MEYTSDSDVSENTRDLIDQGLASVKRKRLNTTSQTRRTGERISVPNVDIPSVPYPLCQENTTGVTSTHGLDIASRGMAIGQNHNNTLLYCLMHMYILRRERKARYKNTI